MDNLNLSWHQVLINKGIDSSIANSLIGFISWNKDQHLNDLGREINQVLSNHEGKVIARDVVSSNYGDLGLLFVKKEISDETSNKIFDIIMDYEQNQVYGTDQNL